MTSPSDTQGKLHHIVYKHLNLVVGKADSLLDIKRRRGEPSMLGKETLQCSSMDTRISELTVDLTRTKTELSKSRAELKEARLGWQRAKQDLEDALFELNSVTKKLRTVVASRSRLRTEDFEAAAEVMCKTDIGTSLRVGVAVAEGRLQTNFDETGTGDDDLDLDTMVDFLNV